MRRVLCLDALAKRCPVDSVEELSSSLGQLDARGVPVGADLVSPDAWEVGTAGHHVGRMIRRQEFSG